MDQADLQTWSSTAMRQALKKGELCAKSYQTIFGWDDEQLSDAIERAYEALERANIKPIEPWRNICTQDSSPLLTWTSVKQVNAEADLVSRSFYTDGLFRLPHQKNGSSPPGWFEPTMVYNWRDPGFLYDFPSIAQEFLRWVRPKAERRVALEAETTMERPIDLSAPSPPPMKSSKLKKLLRKQAKQPSTAAQREDWKFKEAERSRMKLLTGDQKRRRNTSSIESSPTRSTGRKRRQDALKVESLPTEKAGFSLLAPLGSLITDIPHAATALRSKFLGEVEVEVDDDEDYESGGDYEPRPDYWSEADSDSEEVHETKKRTQTILWSRELWFDD
jgi:hypothetical protein